ncbi:hypothetical protein KR52_07115 [Synechococcus sp. KORDI-52]|uniref:thermonuclease family protein n=1 Tax=Synechococcus sp. KORDI-52 TaxID=585425 RepID=UPI0004E0A1A1|nr:thermonuclease family protein [Synechococcus sp. KORDI-52]AII48910.1 hypothetical protein KR52_07115 [Synechococcus sp. KORDI-52]
MKRIAAALLMALALPFSSRAELQSVRVLSISNAQQLLVELEGQGRAVRLACLQAPRRSQTPWSTQASGAVHALVKVGDPALFELRSRDVYGRLVGRLLIDGEDLGAALIRQGAVVAWDGFLGRCDDLDYSTLEREAASGGRGVWSAQPPFERPWDVMEREGDGEP